MNSLARVAWRFWTDKDTWVATTILGITLVAALSVDSQAIAWFAGGVSGMTLSAYEYERESAKEHNEEP